MPRWTRRVHRRHPFGNLRRKAVNRARHTAADGFTYDQYVGLWAMRVAVSAIAGRDGMRFVQHQNRAGLIT